MEEKRRRRRHRLRWWRKGRRERISVEEKKGVIKGDRQICTGEGGKSGGGNETEWERERNRDTRLGEGRTGRDTIYGAPNPLLSRWIAGPRGEAFPLSREYAEVKGLVATT